MLTVYLYNNCSTCRDARKWLQDNGISFQEKAICETPPTKKDLETVLKAFDGKMSRLFNTSGMDYRALGLKDKLPTLSKDEAFTLLGSNGKLVKRPFVVGDGVALVGFKKDEWEKALQNK